MLFYKNKMILAHHALDFFPTNAKQEINLTLPKNRLTMQKHQLKNFEKVGQKILKVAQVREYTTLVVEWL